MLADCWLVGCLVFLTKMTQIAGGSPLCLAGRWLVDWFWHWQNDWRQNRDSNDWLVLTDCMAGGSPLCLAGRWLVDWFWQKDWQNVADCWLVGGLVIFTAKLRLKTDWLVLIWLTDGWRLTGRWLVNWYWQRDWQNVGWLLVGGLLGVFEKIETKMTDLSWLTAWLAAPLFA